VIDVVRGYDWPPGFSGRALSTRFVADWHEREAALAKPATKATEAER
jgi:nitronate monooxygenase